MCLTLDQSGVKGIQNTFPQAGVQEKGSPRDG